MVAGRERRSILPEGRERSRTRRGKPPGAIGSILLVLALASGGTLPVSAQTDPGGGGDRPTPSCSPSDAIRVLFLLDVSGSLRTNDPENNRIVGNLRAIDDLLTRARTDGPEQLRRHRGWSFRVAVDTFNNEYRRSGEWLDLLKPGEDPLTGEDHFEEVGRRLGYEVEVRAATLGGGTDYRSALAGARERFEEPVAGGSCDLLFWFTDGRHETDGDPSSFSNRERGEIDELCEAGGTVADLRRIGVWINVIELTENRAPTAILPRLVGTGEECEGLEGQVLGQVSPVSNDAQLVHEIERVLYEVWPRTPIEYLPCSPPERKFTLSTDVEETRVFIDLTAVEDPGAIILSLRPPGTAPFPIEFEERWARIGDTGFLGWQPTRLHRELRVHQLSADLYGTVWGDDQEWALICSGPGYERARIAIDKVETEKSRVVGLERRADNLVGEVQPAPREEEIVLVSARIAGERPGSGRSLDIDEADQQVETNGRFTIAGIKSLVEEALAGTGGCEADVEVSVTKWVVYGTERRLWDIPGSAATVDVDVCVGPLPRIQVAEGDQAETLSVTADGGYLNAVLSIESVMSDNPDVPVEADTAGWRCEVPRDVTQHPCDPIHIHVPDPPGLDTRVGLAVTLEARAAEGDGSETVSHLVPGFLLRGVLPDPDRVKVTRADDGAISVSADGGLRDASLEIVEISGPPGVQMLDPVWRCAVPGGVSAHACEQVISLTVSGAEQAAVLNLTVRASPTTSDRPEWTRTFELIIPGSRPLDVRVVPLPRDPGGNPIPLQVIASPGTVGAVLSVESIKATAAGADTANMNIADSSWTGQDDWRCQVPGQIEDTTANIECDPLYIEWEPSKVSQDSMVDLEILFHVRTETGDDTTRSVSAGTFDLRVWEFSVFRSSLVRLLLLVLAVVIIVRVAAAWARRRWAPIASPHYFTEEAILDDSGRLVLEGGRSPLIDPARYEVTAGLSSPRSSADIGGIRLRVLWWPLLLGNKVRIAAFSGSDDCVAPGGSRRPLFRRGRRFGIVGSSLNRGWAAEAPGGDRVRLVVWDVPDDRTEAQARYEEVLEQAARRLSEVESASPPAASPEEPPPPESDSGPVEVPTDDPFGGDDPFSDDPFGDPLPDNRR